MRWTRASGACRAGPMGNEDVAQQDSQNAVALALERSATASERGSGLHCNPVFADALHRSQQASAPAPSAPSYTAGHTSLLSTPPGPLTFAVNEAERMRTCVLLHKILGAPCSLHTCP